LNCTKNTANIENDYILLNDNILFKKRFYFEGKINTEHYLKNFLKISMLLGQNCNKITSNFHKFGYIHPDCS